MPLSLRVCRRLVAILVLSSSSSPTAVGSEPDGKPGSVDDAAAEEEVACVGFGNFVTMKIVEHVNPRQWGEAQSLQRRGR